MENLQLAPEIGTENKLKLTKAMGEAAVFELTNGVIKVDEAEAVK